MSVSLAVLDTTTGKIVNPLYVVDSGIIPELAEGYEFLIIREGITIPDYDARLYEETVVKRVSDEGELDEEYTDYRMYVTDKYISETDCDFRKDCVDDAKNKANIQLLPSTETLETFAVAWALTDKKASGNILEDDETEYLENLHNVTGPIYENYKLALAMKDKIDGGEEVDIDDGWVITEDTNE